MQPETDRTLTADEKLQLRGDIVWRYTSGMDSIYEDFYRVMERRSVSISDMCEVIERCCDWDTADGFREWVSEGEG